MRRPKAEPLLSLRGQRCLQLLLTLALIYASLLFVCEFPFVARRPATPHLHHHGLPLDSEAESTLARPSRLFHPSPTVVPHRRSLVVSGLSLRRLESSSASSDLHESASHAWDVGRKLFDELESSPASALAPSGTNGTEERCPHSITLSGAQLEERGGLLLLPCGLTLGSHITLVGRPRRAHAERDPTIAATRGGGGTVMVSQFMMELQGLRSVEGEDPPRILYFNPRLKGDWSGRPVIEHNNCYRMQWGPALRCDGWGSRPDEEREAMQFLVNGLDFEVVCGFSTVDGLVKCEKWNRDENKQLEDSKTTWWLNHLIDKENKVPFDWSFPFVEDKLFVLTLSAGFEGCHVSVDGRHVTSFPYRTGFDLEDATGLSLNGDLNIHSIIAASLPTSHPSFAPQRYLEMSSKWQTSPLPAGPIDLFIGILSAGNHFGERMAARKSWMSAIRNSPNVVALFFVAMHRRKEVNVELKKEAEFFGDIVIVPFLESYDLVVLKTVAICEYGLRTASSKYIMKCDDDTFVRVDSVMKEVENVPVNRSLYMGNINYHHKPLRSGKWAVTYEEWHEEDYPPYANGAGYVISSDIARFIVSKFERHTLRLFKMEDVSMGIWVEQFNKSRPVEYIHSLKFCQFGCIDDYLTAHYQSPRQMICMWEKMQMGRPECCNLG